MSEKKAPAQAPTESSKGLELSDILLPILAAVGTGIGLIGFVIFFGGFVLWTRFNAAGLPANEAVAQVPRNDLVATGASFLVPAFLAAFAVAAVALTGLDALIGRRRRRRRKDLQAASDEAENRLDQLTGEFELAGREFERAENKMKELLENEPALDDPGPAGDQARAAYQVASDWRTRSDNELYDLRAERIPKAKKERNKARQELEGASRYSDPERFEQALIGCIVMVVAELLVLRPAIGQLQFEDALLAFGAAALSILIVIVVASTTARQTWFVAFIFLGVGVTIAVFTYARTHHDPKVSPFVALHSRHLPVTGFFVAETPDAIFLGKPQPNWHSTGKLEFEHDEGALVRLPKESLSGVAVGPLLDEEAAFRRSTQLALVICNSSTGPAPASRRKPRCSPAAIRRLHIRLAKLAGYS